MLTDVGKEAAQPCTLRNALSAVAQPSLTMMGQRQSLPPTPSASPCHNPVWRRFSGYARSFPIGEPLPAHPFLCQPSNNMLCKGTETQASTDPSLSQGCDWSLVATGIRQASLPKPGTYLLSPTQGCMSRSAAGPSASENRLSLLAPML